MKFQIGLIGVATLLLTGCQLPEPVEQLPSNDFIKISESLQSLAAPNQDLTAVRIDPIDGCYIYRYVGPVETTFLPLRTTDGRPICTRKPGDTPDASS